MPPPAPRASALVLAVLLLAAWPFPGTGGIDVSAFGGGAQELVISFPPGGGANGSVSLALPSGATVLSAVMDITGLPLFINGSLDHSTPEKLGLVPSSRNLTINASGARLAPFNWGGVQSTDEQFRNDEGENISVGGGVRLSDAIIGGESHSFTVVSGVNLNGMPSVNCTPDGKILVAWSERNLSANGFDSCFRRFDESGNKDGPMIVRTISSIDRLSGPRAVSDRSGNMTFLWENRWDEDNSNINVTTFTTAFNLISEMSIPEDTVRSLRINPSATCGPSGRMLVTYDRVYTTTPDPTHHILGFWMDAPTVNIPIAIFTVNASTPGRISTVRIPVGSGNQIAFASSFYAGAGSWRAYLSQMNASGAWMDPPIPLGGNSSYTTPTSVEILDDGSTVVAFTASYPGHDYEVHCARVASNGSIIGQFILANASGTDYFAPSLCRLEDNRFACVWGSSYEGTDIELQGRVFRADGTPEGAVFSMGKTYGGNASWEICARGNSSLALVVRSDNPFPNGSIRVEVVELTRALNGHIDSPVFDKPGNIVADVRLANGTSYSIDVFDAVTRKKTASGLQNGDPVRNWSPYFLRLNLQRAAFNASLSDPTVLQFGVASRICDFFEDEHLVDGLGAVEVTGGQAILLAGNIVGHLDGQQLDLPYRAVRLDNLSWTATKGITPSLQSKSDGHWSEWETIYSNPESELSTPPGEAARWKLDYIASNQTPLVAESITLSYSLLHRTGFLSSAPVNLTDGGFTRYRVNWTSNGPGTVSALVTTDGGMTYALASNGAWQPSAGPGRALQAMLVLEGDGNQSPVLSGFSVDYEARSLPSGLTLEMDQSYRWSPPGGSDLEGGVRVRDFSSPLNAVLARHPGGGDISIPLNFSSATAGLLRLSNLRVVLNMPPVITGAWPSDDPVLEQGTGQRFSINASDQDADTLQMDWRVDGQVAGTGPQFDYTAPGSAGNHTVTATVSDGKASASRLWNVTVVFVDRNRPPVMLERMPAQNPVINETETAVFAVRATDPEGRPLRFSWSVDAEKVSVADNLTWRTWYNSSGVHNVSVTVSDGEKSVSTAWNLTVLNVNRPPVISDWRPENSPACAPGTKLDFAINVSDPDGDALDIGWLVDGRPVGGATSANFTTVAIWSDGRTHTVGVVASDGNLSASRHWVVRVIGSGGDSALDASDPACLAAAVAVAFVVAAVALAGARRRGAER